MPRPTILVSILAALLLFLSACDPAGNGGSVISVAIIGGDQTILIGDVLTLTATVVTTGNASDSVTWGSSDETVATIDAVGNVTTLATGTTNITATSTADPSKNDTITLTVTEADAAFGEDDLDQAVASVGSDLEELGTAFETELGVAALGAFPGFFPTVSEPIVVSDGALSLRFIRPSQAGSLPRGIWEWDDDAFEWVDVGNSTDLVLRWSFVDAASDTRAAAITVDWGVTTQVRDEFGDLVEVPRAMNVTMTVDTTTVADVDAEFDWYSAATCTEGILEPDRVYVNGSFGVDATLALNAITLEMTPARALNGTSR